MQTAIETVLHDKTYAIMTCIHTNCIVIIFSYAENAKKIRRMLAKKPFSAEELLVRWTEFAGEFKSLPELDNYGRHLNFITYYMLDVFVPAMLVVVLLIYCLAKLLMFIIRRFISLFIASGKKKVE